MAKINPKPLPDVTPIPKNDKLAQRGSLSVNRQAAAHLFERSLQRVEVQKNAAEKQSQIKNGVLGKEELHASKSSSAESSEATETTSSLLSGDNAYKSIKQKQSATNAANSAKGTHTQQGSVDNFNEDSAQSELPNSISRKKEHEQDENASKSSLQFGFSPVFLQNTLLPVEASGRTHIAGSSSAAVELGQFRTIENILEHLEAMDARETGNTWRFSLELDNSVSFGLELNSEADGGWGIGLDNNHAEAQWVDADLQQLKLALDNAGVKVNTLGLMRDYDKT